MALLGHLHLRQNTLPRISLSHPSRINIVSLRTTRVSSSKHGDESQSTPTNTATTTPATPKQGSRIWFAQATFHKCIGFNEGLDTMIVAGKTRQEVESEVHNTLAEGRDLYSGLRSLRVWEEQQE